MTTKEMNKTILSHYGLEAQLEKTEEELIELLHAVRNFRNGKASPDEVISEIADVKNMLQQVVLSMPKGASDLIKEIQHKKAIRQLQRIEE